MIDNNKIKEASIKALKESVYNNYMYTCPYIEGFYACVKWIQEELLKNLWHPTSEEPKENFDLVCINNIKEFREISSYNSDRFDDLFGKRWEAACRMFNIYKWAYKDDLFPKEGGEQ